MVTLALPTLASAVLCWPRRTATLRLRAILGDGPRARRRWSLRRSGPALAVGLPAFAGLVVFGPGVGLAAAIGAATIVVRWRGRDRDRAELAAAAAMADAMQGLVTELRAGAHPVAAAEAAARDARAPAADVLTAVAATARLGGDLATALRRFAEHTPALAPALRPLAHAWSLAHQHGLPLADVLDAVRRDVAGRVRFAGRIRARMAGPKASGTVLAALPVLGVLLGQGMGASPTHVLFATGAGQILLAVGVMLGCAGVVWIARLTSRAVST